MRLSIVIPAHNEEARIGYMLDAYLPFFSQRYGRDVEIVVVINGSTDNTAGVVAGYVEKFPQLRYIVEPRPIGKGGALILGFGQAKGDLVGFADADGSTPPAAFQDLVDRIGDAGTAVASRWCRGATVSPRQPIARRIASRVFNLLTRFLFGLRLTDTQCGAKLMRREALVPILPQLGITRWAFDVDLLFQLRRAGHRIIEVPTTWRDVAGSKIEIAAVSAEMLAAIVRLRLLYSPLRWVVAFYDRFLGPLIHPEGLDQDHLFRHSVVLLTCTQVANVGNLIFQAVMMRMLDGVQYGIMAAMMGIFVTITMPMGALTWAAAHFSASLIKEGRARKVGSMIAGVGRDLALAGLVIMAAALIFHSRLESYFKLDSPTPLLLTLVALCISISSSLFLGSLQGAQAFVWLSGIGVIWSFTRLVLAVVFVAMGGAAIGALFGHAASMLVFPILGFIGLRQVIGCAWSDPERTPGYYPYFFRYALAFAGYAVLMNTDVVLVKHYFGADQAGSYAMVAMVGRIILFLPQPIVTVMFPKVVSSGGTTQASRRTLIKALTLAGMMVCGTALICSLFAESALYVLSGHRSPELAPLVRLMVWALCPLSLTFFIMSFELAQRRFAVTLPLLVCAFGYLGGLALWHETMLQVICVLAAAGGLAFILSVACLPWRLFGRNTDSATAGQQR